MRRSMLALVAVGTAVCPAQAELRWQTAGVRQASHSAAAPAESPRRAVAKAPTFVRPAVSEQGAPAPAARPAVAESPAAPMAAVIDPAVQQACGCVGGCACGLEPGCAVADPGCGFVEASCGCGVPDCGCAMEPGCGLEPGCAVGCGEPCGCGDVGCAGACGDACGVPVMLYLPPIRELSVFAGVQAFKNPLDGANRDRGSFGFNEGVNLGGPMTLLGLPAVGYQIGYRGTQNQLHGDDDLNTSDGHDQHFVTAGLFHRKPVGLQYGVVYDFLRDERQGSADFGQVRGLLSVTNPRGNEIGFQFASKTNENILGGVTYEATNQYLFFFRKHGCEGGEVRLYGGFDDDSKGILGADAAVPLSPRWSLETGFTYVIPEEDGAGVGAEEESWNLGMGLVWHYGKRARQCFQGQYRPMFQVADNGSMIVDDRP